MGVYSSNRTSDASVLESVEVKDFNFDNFHEGALAIVAESEQNLSMLMRAIGQDELFVYESTGLEKEYSVTEAGGFVDRIKEFLMNVWAKIKGLFKKFFAMFDSFVKTDKEFVTKYKKEIYDANGKLKDFKFKGYNFTIKGNDDIGAVANKIGALSSGSLTMDKVKSDRENMGDVEDKMRGEALGESAMNGSEFSKALFEKFRSGESEKQEIELHDVGSIVNELMAAAEAKKSAQKAYDALEKTINNMIKAYEKISGENIKKLPGDNKDNKTSDAVTLANHNVSITKAQLNILQTYNGALLTALKDQSRQNKSVCVSLVHYSPKKEAASWEHNVNESFLSSVKFK